MDPDHHGQLSRRRVDGRGDVQEEAVLGHVARRLLHAGAAEFRGLQGRRPRFVGLRREVRGVGCPSIAVRFVG